MVCQFFWATLHTHKGPRDEFSRAVSLLRKVGGAGPGGPGPHKLNSLPASDAVNQQYCVQVNQVRELLRWVIVGSLFDVGLSIYRSLR